MKYMRDSKAICDYVRALEQYFITTGQINRVRIAADEPGDIEKYRNSIHCSTNLHRISVVKLRLIMQNSLKSFMIISMISFPICVVRSPNMTD